MAQQLANSVHSHGGLLTADDLAGYQAADREILTGHYTAHGQLYDVLTSPPPSSGGIALIETLNILSGFDLPALGADRSPAQVHIIAEAFRRAYMDPDPADGDGVARVRRGLARLHSAGQAVSLGGAEAPCGFSTAASCPAGAQGVHGDDTVLSR